MNARSLVPGWPWLLVLVAVGVGGAPALVQTARWRPPPVGPNERGELAGECRGTIYEGDKRVASAADIASLRGITCIRGTLTIGTERCEPFGNEPTPAAVSIENLKHLRELEVVTGPLRMHNIVGLRDTRGLERLVSAATIELCKTGELEAVVLPELRATGPFKLLAETHVSTIDAPRLMHVGEIVVAGSPALQRVALAPDVELGVLRFVDGETGPADASAFAGITAMGALYADETRHLLRIELPSLTLLHSVDVKNAASLRVVSLPAVKALGTAHFHDAAALELVDLGALTGLVASIRLGNVAALQTWRAPPQLRVMSLSASNTGLHTLSIAGAVDLHIVHNAALITLENAPSPSVSGFIENNPKLNNGIDALKGRPRLSVCANNAQPPCEWPTNGRLQPGNVAVLPAGHHDSATHVNIPKLRQAPTYKASRGYNVVTSGRHVLLVQLDRDSPVDIVRFDLFDETMTAPVRLPHHRYSEHRLFFDRDEIVFIGRHDAVVKGGSGFVVDIVRIPDRGVVVTHESVDVGAVARDARVLMHGLSAVMVTASGAAREVGFLADPSSTRFPDLPLVFRLDGDKCEPQTVYGTVR